MKNIDKYKYEILRQLGKTGNWAMKDGKIGSCGRVTCDACAFGVWSDVNCSDAKTKWLNTDEDEEARRFSQEDKKVIAALAKVLWVTRDEDGDVYGFSAYPHKDVGLGSWELLDKGEGYQVCLDTFSNATFEPIRWEDSKPTSREKILSDEK